MITHESLTEINSRLNTLYTPAGLQELVEEFGAKANRFRHELRTGFQRIGEEMSGVRSDTTEILRLVKEQSLANASSEAERRQLQERYRQSEEALKQKILELEERLTEQAPNDKVKRSAFSINSNG